MAEEIVIPEGSTYEVQPGAHRLSNLEIRKNATLFFTGSTTLFVGTVKTFDGAKIVYRSLDTKDDCVFTLNPLDASGISDLSFVGHGKAGHGFPAGSRAADGPAGRDAKDPKPFKSSGHKAERGGVGQRGGDGSYGEDAVDFVAYLPKVAPGAKISFYSVGGNGGRGQDGGHGGRGGNRSTFHDGRDGGPGGDGGNGGTAGDAGKAFVFAVVADEEFDKLVDKQEPIKAVQIVVNCAAGTPGDGGSGGSGGQPGQGAHVGGSGLGAGPDGRDGQMGGRGDGPLQVSDGTSWVQVDVMTASAYSQFIAQQLASLG